MHIIFCNFKSPRWVKGFQGRVAERLVSENRLSSTTRGNREMNQIYMPSQMSNITRKKTFSPISCHVFQENETENKKHKIALISL